MLNRRGETLIFRHCRGEVKSEVSEVRGKDELDKLSQHRASLAA